MSRELDAKVAEAMGWQHLEPPAMPVWQKPGAVMYDLPYYYTDDAAALRVVQWMRERGWYCQLHINPDYYWAHFVRWDTDQDGEAESKERLSEAICLAFLRAVGIDTTNLERNDNAN